MIEGKCNSHSTVAHKYSKYFELIKERVRPRKGDLLAYDLSTFLHCEADEYVFENTSYMRCFVNLDKLVLVCMSHAC